MSAATGGAQRPYVPAEAVGGVAWVWDAGTDAYVVAGAELPFRVRWSMALGWYAAHDLPAGPNIIDKGFYGPDGAMHAVAKAALAYLSPGVAAHRP